MQKQVQIVMLPTKKATVNSDVLWLTVPYYGSLEQILSNQGIGAAQHLYILSNEEIKEGDWMLMNDNHSSGRLRKCYHLTDNNPLWNGKDWDTLKGEHYFIDPKESEGWGYLTKGDCKKIVASTDPDLIIKKVKGGAIWNIPTLSEGFINKFIKMYNLGTPITKIMVEMEAYFKPENGHSAVHKDLRLKIRPDNTIITHPVEVKTYTEEQLFKAMGEYKTWCDINNKYITPKDWFNGREYLLK